MGDVRDDRIWEEKKQTLTVSVEVGVCFCIEWGDAIR